MSSKSTPSPPDLVVTDHGQARWRERSSQPWRDLEIVRRESLEIDFPPSNSDGPTFYHPPTGIILITGTGDGADVLVTCLDLSDLSRDDQDHVRNQVRDQ